ncbi:MAG: hypothetical protein J5757_03500 [Lachnospiraceae bacterium]|nr:hypothetical protein [Lachnospiraceae bacterium]
MRKVKKIVLLSVLATALVLSACLVFGYGNEAQGSIGEVHTKGINYISPSKSYASATTTTYIENYPSPTSANTYVDATFYWVDYVNNQMGTVYKEDSCQSASTVIPDTVTNRLYYKVISNHYVWYGQGSWSYTNLTTIAQ